MSGKLRTASIALAVLAFAVLTAASAWPDVTGRPHDLSLDNPLGHCINCHDLHQTGLGEGYAHNLKRANEIAVCYQCHAGALSDYSSIDPTMSDPAQLKSQYDIRAEFGQTHIHFERYGMDGEHNKCSYCHNPHGVFDTTSTTRLPKLLSAGPDAVTSTDEYCFVCHNSDDSPPHEPFPNISVGAQFRFSRTDYKQMTHSTFFRATTVTEPVPDTAYTYDDNPYGAGKDISCLTCHRPHGSPNDHMLKSADDETFCLACHDGSKAADLTQFDVTGHGKPGVDRVCQECHFPHGTGQENALKAAITDPHTDTGNASDVNGSGVNEVCFACHGAVSSDVYSYPYASNISGWLSSGVTSTWDGSLGHSAVGCLKQVNTVVADRYSYVNYQTVLPNTTYTLSGYVYIPTALEGNGIWLRAVEYDYGYAQLMDNKASAIVSTAGSWRFQSLTFTTTASTTKLIIRLNIQSKGTVYWDDVKIAETPYMGGYFTGRAGYEASVHYTSPNAHNPQDATGDQQPGECDNCHNPHGKGYAGMLVAQAQNVCFDCHNATTPNTVSGDDVQAAFQMSSHHDLTQVGCPACHNVHKVTASAVMTDPHNPADTLTQVKAFCLGCHAGNIPPSVGAAPNVYDEWAGGGHDTAHVLVCDDCHEPHGSPNSGNINYRPLDYGGYTASFTSGMGFTARSFCESCHNRTGAGYKGAKKIPTGAGYVMQHDQGETEPCSTCHTAKHDPRLSNYTGTASFYTLSCLGCHTGGVGNPYPYPDEQFNTPGDSGDSGTRRSIHNITYQPYTTVAVVDCANCHGSDHEADHNTSSKLVDPDPDNPASGSLDITASNAFCLQCHDNTPVAMGGITPPNILDTYTSAGHGKASADILCSQCHEYHGSMSEKLLKGAIDGKPVLGTYSGNNVTVCTACHSGTDAALPKWPGFSVYSGSIHAFGNPTTGNLVTDGRHGPGVCVNCHNPHGARIDGKTTHSMTRKLDEDTCYVCHASGFDNFTSKVAYTDRWTRFGSALDIDKTSGALHVGRTEVATGTYVYDGLASNNNFPDDDSVVSVKLKVPEFTRTDGNGQIGLRIEDTSGSGRYVSIFYRAHSSPRNWVVRFYGDGGVFATLPLFGDEDNAYHTLKLVRDKAAGQVDAYVDDTFMYTCTFTTGGYFTAKLFNLVSNTVDATSEAVDAWFDEFSVAYSSDITVHNTSSGDDVQARFNMLTRHHISDYDQLGEDGLPGTADDSKVECTDCHDPHTITEQLMAFRNISGNIVPIEADQEFCLKCHDGDPPTGVLFPAEGVWDKSGYDFSAHGNPLMRNFTFGNYSNGVSYACKVCHNPHGSDQAALQRESWDINRDGIPDDIDGDGVLDSSTMVGFIGYSTGSRKVILVDSPRPSFQRISTTIPYQANGSIDVELCLNCHDGTPAPDVESDFQKLSHHDVTYEEQQAGGGSKIECYNCHDQHRAQSRDDNAGHYPTTNPDPPREPMPGDAKFCLVCHDNELPAGVSFGAQQLKDIKLSYNPYDLRDADGYDLITSYNGHFVQATGEPLMCRACHNQHGSNYYRMLRDDTESAKAGHDASQPIQEMQPVALRDTDTFGGGDDMPLSTTTERCLTCHSGVTTYNGSLLPLPPPPDANTRGFALPPVGKHPDMKPEVTIADEVNGHIYKAVFAVVTTPGSVKADCTLCHDSHNPYITTNSGLLMDCYECHNENTSLPDVQTEFNDNPTNATRSQSIHPIHYDPTGTDSYAVECLKCHDQSRHMQGVVRLRKDPSAFDNFTSDSEVWADPVNTGTINQFCLECHAPGSTGTSFFRGGTEHVPPKLPAGYDSGAHFTDGSLRCTGCHEYHGSVNKGLRKNEFGDEESFCYGCHDNAANSMSGINVQSRFAMSSHHDVDTASQNANGTKVECEDCHNPHVVTRANPVVAAGTPDTAAPADDAFCIGCHDSDSSAGVKFPGLATGTGAPEWNTSTGAWNRWDKQSFTTSPHEAQGVHCLGCHDPHGSPNYSMLLQNISTTTGIAVGFGLHSTARGDRTEELGVNSVCRSCHADAMGVYDGYANFSSLTFGHKGGIDKNCTYCHNPHGSSVSGMLRSDKPLNMDMTDPAFGSVYNFKGFANHTTGAPYYTFCSSRNCHTGERDPLDTDTFDMDRPVDNFTGGETTSSHHPIKEGVIGCTSCHKEHGSANSPDLRAPYYRESNWPILFKSGVGVYDTYRDPGYNYTGNTQFLELNYFEQARSGQPDATNRNKVTTVNPPDDANDLCYMCHQKDDIIGSATNGMTGTNTRFIGHEAIEGGATCTQNISRDGNGLGTDYHKFSCSACHLPHSIGRSKLVKVGCFSQGDGQNPNSTYAPVFGCHAYNGWGNYNYGWRSLTGGSKTDFNRPPNPVSDLSYVLDTDLTLHLEWSAVADSTGQGVDHYNVYRSAQYINQSAKPYATRVLKGLAGAATGSPMGWTDYTCQPDATYYYTVVACDADNNESFVSNCVTVAVGADITIPGTIDTQALTQVGGTYNAKVSWNDPSDNVNVTQYKVYRLSGPGPLTDGDIQPGNYMATVVDGSQSADGSADASLYSYTDTTTQFGLEYSYAVVSLDAAGNVSQVPAGADFAITISDPAPAPVTTLTVKPVSVEMKAQLAWSAPLNIGAIASYKVYRKEGSALMQSDLIPGNLLAQDITALTWTDDAVPQTGTSYYYAVTAVDESSGKESILGNSPSVNLTVPPTGVDAVILLDSDVKVTWSAPAYTTGLTGYSVYYSRESGPWTLAGSPATASYTADMTGKEPGGYEFAVTAKYSTYSGTTPYESVRSASDAVTLADTLEPDAFTATGSLEGSSDDIGRVSWLAPAENNFAGYTPSGLSYYRIDASYDQGTSWATVISSRLANPGFETHTGTVDDANMDTFTSWSYLNTTQFAVSDALFDSRAIRIRYNGSGDRYILSAEPDTGATIANKMYSMSFWAKASKPTTIEFFMQTATGTDIKIGQTTTAIGTRWQRFSSSGTFGASATARYARVIIRPSLDTTAEITIDGVRLSRDTEAVQAIDGTYYQAAGMGSPGSAQSFDDPVSLTSGGSAMYRVRAVDGEGNSTPAAATGVIYAKPTTIADLYVKSVDAAAANEMTFSPSGSLAGLYGYRIYAAEQSTPLASLVGATLIDTLTPTVQNANIASQATATASHTYSSYVASNVKDGSVTTRWDGGANVGANWLMLDFGTPRLLSGVNFEFYNNGYYRPADYLIQTYDGTSWVTQATVIGNSNNSPEYNFVPAVDTAKVRIYITRTYNNTMTYRPIIYEFRAFGAEKYVHDLQNTALRAEPGHTYAYAVFAEDVNGVLSSLSSGPVTVNALLDKEPPAKINDLGMTTEPGTSKAVLTWSTPIDNLGYGINTGAAAYRIYRLPTSSVGTPEAVTDDNYQSASVVYTGAYASSVPGTFNNYTATWYDHKGVYYAVSSADPSGNWSQVSNSPYIVVGKDAEAPTPPFITNCVPVASPEVDVYWDAALDNVAVNGYRLFRAPVDEEPFLTDQCITENNVGQAEVAVSLIPYSADSTADTGGVPGKTYYFALRAWDDENNMSNISNCAVATVRTESTDLTPPVWGATPLTVVQQPYPDIDLFWDPATDLDDSGGAGTIDHYDVYRSLSTFSATTDPGVSNIATLSGVRHSYIDNTGNHDTTYYYGVVAVDASDNSNAGALSNVGSATVAVAPSPDNVPPTVPADLAAATGVYPTINISWTSSTDVDDAANQQQLLYYKLYRSDYPLDITDANKDNAAQVNTYIMANDAASYPARGIGDTAYNYRLEAFDIAGNGSGLSAQVTAAVASLPCTDTTPPSAPGGLDATIGPSPDIDLTWTQATDAGACHGEVDHYQLYKADFEITGSTDLRTLVHIHVAGNAVSFIDSSGEPNKTYWYVVAAVDSSGNESVASNIITRTTAADTMAPAAVADLMATEGSGSILLTWCKPSDNVGVDHYDIFRKEQGTILTDADTVDVNKLTTFENAGTCLSYLDSAVTSGHTYSYAVIAVDTAGNRATISRGELAGDTIESVP